MICSDCHQDLDDSLFRKWRKLCKPCEALASKVRRRKPERTIQADIQERKERSAVRGLKSRLNDALSLLEQVQLERDTVLAVPSARRGVPSIAPRERTGVLREATAVALASDWHIEERVLPEQVNGKNAYNLGIAHRRVERFFSGLQYLIRYHQDHFLIRDLLLWLGGDLITGFLREENLESNELSPVQAIATLQVWLSDGIKSLLQMDDLHLTIVCSSGNHGRLTDKMRPSTREANSIEWLLYNILAREFENDPRVKFILPAGAHTYVEVYGKLIRFLHGDDARYAGGVGGIMVPLMRALARWDTVYHAHLTCLGHFHQYYDTDGLVCNGSLIGYNPFALSIGARFEEPRQAFFLLDSRRGKTFSADIWVRDEEEEASSPP